MLASPTVLALAGAVQWQAPAGCLGEVTIAPGGETDGDPDGCGSFPPGDGGFTCVCEMCSIDVDDVDAAWVEGEADLSMICECMCGGAGCGSPA